MIFSPSLPECLLFSPLMWNATFCHQMPGSAGVYFWPLGFALLVSVTGSCQQYFENCNSVNTNTREATSHSGFYPVEEGKAFQKTILSIQHPGLLAPVSSPLAPAMCSVQLSHLPHIQSTNTDEKPLYATILGLRNRIWKNRQTPWPSWSLHLVSRGKTVKYTCSPVWRSSRGMRSEPWRRAVAAWGCMKSHGTQFKTALFFNTSRFIFIRISNKHLHESVG